MISVVCNLYLFPKASQVFLTDEDKALHKHFLWVSSANTTTHSHFDQVCKLIEFYLLLSLLVSCHPFPYSFLGFFSMFLFVVAFLSSLGSLIIGLARAHCVQDFNIFVQVVGHKR